MNFNKWQKLVLFFKELIQNPYLINLPLETNEFWQNNFQKSYSHTKILPQIDFCDFLHNTEFELDQYTFLSGGSMVTDLILLQNLSQQIPNCKYFEIGTWRGESAVNVCNFTQKCYTLNLSPEELKKLGFDQSYIDEQGILSRNNSKIKHLYGNSSHYDFAALNEKFDLIFIDGDHHYAAVKNDTKKVFEHLAHSNSIVVWHDYGYSPEKVRFEVYKGILDGLPSELQKNLYHISNTMCAIYLPNYQFEYQDITKLKTFKVNIEKNNLNV